jgi:hypothetical protein
MENGKCTGANIDMAEEQRRVAATSVRRDARHRTTWLAAERRRRLWRKTIVSPSADIDSACGCRTTGAMNRR